MDRLELFDFLLREPDEKACDEPDPIHVVYGDTELILCRRCHWKINDWRSSGSGRHSLPHPPLAALDILLS